MSEIELFFSSWKYTSVAFFSFIGFIVAMGRIFGFILKVHKAAVKEAVEQALMGQRQRNQAEVLDELIKIINAQQEGLRRYSKAKEDDAINSAIVRQLLESRSV